MLADNIDAARCPECRTSQSKTLLVPGQKFLRLHGGICNLFRRLHGPTCPES
jgi:hypothetical protein